MERALIDVSLQRHRSSDTSMTSLKECHYGCITCMLDFKTKKEMFDHAKKVHNIYEEF